MLSYINYGGKKGDHRHKHARMAFTGQGLNRKSYRGRSQGSKVSTAARPRRTQGLTLNWDIVQ